MPETVYLADPKLSFFDGDFLPDTVWEEGIIISWTSYILFGVFLPDVAAVGLFCLLPAGLPGDFFFGDYLPSGGDSDSKLKYFISGIYLGVVGF